MLDHQEALEAAAVASISHQGFDPQQWRAVPFRSPHHSSSGVALVGGGRPPRPGEISLAHHGVLFLDELPEFDRRALDCLREPLESGCITISRASYQTIFPAQFQFVAAMNPCPCGYAGSREEACRCSPDQIKRYANKISGPLRDRIDMQIPVTRLCPLMLHQQAEQTENSATIRARIVTCREIQQRRQGKCNNVLTVPELEKYAKLNASGLSILTKALSKFNLSARSYHRIIKIARTIADLSASPEIQVEHLSEAIQFRYFDRMQTAT
jgi:magnesium chelatase family protein